MTSDGTKNQTDVTLGAGKGGTPQQTISLEEANKRVLDATTAVKADVGRYKAEAEKAFAAATAASQRLERMLKKQAEEELEAAKDEPDKLAAIRERQRRIDIENELEKAKLELDGTKTRLAGYETKEAETSREAKVREIATRLGIDAAKLATLSKFTNGTPEAIEEIAKELPKTGKTLLKVDSNSSIGGQLGWEDVRAAYIKNPYDPAVRARYMEMRGQKH